MTPTTVYTKPDEGEWVQPKMRGYKLSRCDCGLVHKMDFRIVGKRVQFRAWRDGKATGGKRKNKDFAQFERQIRKQVLKEIEGVMYAKR